MFGDGSFQKLKMERLVSPFDKCFGCLLYAPVLSLLVFSIMAIVPPCFAEGELPSHSSEESIKRELLIKKVFPMPGVFEWNGHEVTFKESWVEKPAPGGHYNLLCFRLSVDNSLTKEYAIQRKTNRSMEFRETGTKGQTLLIGSSVFYPLRNFAKFGKGLGETVHHVEMKNPFAKKIALRVCTYNHDTDSLEKTDTVLTFDGLRANQ